MSSDIYDEVVSTTHSLAFKWLIQTQFAYTPPDWQEYRVMYLNLNEDITVIRQRWSPPPPSAAGSCPDLPQSSLSQPHPPSYDFYQAPFVNFPIIRSHIHPFCIIYNAGQKLHHKPYFTPPSHIDSSDLHIVRRLYDQFTAPPPPSWGRDVPIAPRDPPSDEGGSRKRSRHTKDPVPLTRQRRSFAKTSRESHRLLMQLVRRIVVAGMVFIHRRGCAPWTFQPPLPLRNATQLHLLIISYPVETAKIAILEI
jgi:hypothetical protein